jgi:hypothetical protein
MKRIAINPRFINEAGNDLIPSKIHTIRKNYDYWKKSEGKEVALFTWEDKPYRSKQKVFCVKKIVSVQEVYLYKDKTDDVYFTRFQHPFPGNAVFDRYLMAKNDGFEDAAYFRVWFAGKEYKPGKMAILHFTDFMY